MGRWLESKAKSKTGLAIKKLIELKPQTVLIKKDGFEKEIHLDELSIGDLVIIKPGGKIPADGKVITGYSTMDESMITGEPIPVQKQPGDRVIDFGCGFGETLILWAKRFGISGVGIDIRPYACEQAVKRIAGCKLSERLEIACGDAGEYAHPPHSFDLAACIGATFIWDSLKVPCMR